tara:strand:- start:2822 stop:3361 length:540 start_codon:yes stop_codon:yes gene_type:complete
MQHKYYDWTKLIDAKARSRMADQVALGIKAGKFWHNSPKFQTNWNVFSTPSQDYVNLKMSFIWSCFDYLQKEVKINNIQSWSFMTKLPGEDRDKLWHHHNHNGATTTVSGVYYMHLPEDVKDFEKAGTELAPNGVEGDGKYFAEWRTGHWMIYPGKVWHRPGVLQSNEDRFIVAADMEF